jgi:transposase
MTLQPQDTFSIPEETIRVARAAYPKGNVYMQMRDALGPIYRDEAFAHLFPHNGRPVEAPWRLALITVMQFAEELPDREAADAVRGRIDWKYALGLELTDSGFDASVLCEFRKRLVQGEAEQLLLDTMLTLFKERGWLKARGRQRTDSTHVLAKIRAINRLVCVGETMRFALNSLAVIAPDWLVAHCDETWLDRYAHRFEEAHLPKGQTERQAIAEQIGQDGANLLTDLLAPTAPEWLRQVPAVERLRQVWIQNYGYENGQLRWRSNENIPPASRFIGSPYDTEARYGKKRETTWVGYKVHLTETCDEQTPHLITHVATSIAPSADDSVTLKIHEDLKQRELLPSDHWLDAGYVTGKNLVNSSQEFGVQVIGPTRANHKWQASLSPGFDVNQFDIDWQAQQAICPEGHTSQSWTPAIDCGHNEVIKIKFSPKDCRDCPSRTKCTRSVPPRRTLTIRPKEQYLALQQARALLTSKQSTPYYSLRQGVEGTVSQGVRAFGMRRSRYIGSRKTHLQHIAIASAINIVRLVAWLQGERPEKTRTSAFARLFS